MDDFSDDGFDDLNDITLQELENDAIQYTQAQRQGDDSQQTLDKSNIETSDYYGGIELEDDDLDYTEVTNGLFPSVARHVPDQSVPQPQSHQLPRRPSLQPQQRWSPPSAPAPVNPPVLSSRPRHPVPLPSYVPPVTSQRFTPTVGAPYRPQTTTQYGRPLHPPPAPSARQDRQYSQAQPPAVAGNDVLTALQQRVRALESELNAARGEVAIIRSNSTKAEQDHTAEIARVKKLNAEQAAKQERAVEAAVAAERKATTELQFLQRDLKDASTRPRPKDAAPTAAEPGTTTPKKLNKTWGMADGFDGMDIAPSPTKARGKSRDAGPVAVPLSERTPTKGKRKRPTVDSPVMALETHEEDAVMVDHMADAAMTVPHPEPGTNLLPFEFLPVILDHGSMHAEPPTFDILSRYSYPSDPSTSFASLIFRELPLMGNPLNPVQLLVDFSHLVIRLWSQCLNEKYLQPIWDLCSLLSFTLQLQTVSVVPQIIVELVPAAQNSICLVAEARFRSIDGDISSDPVTEAQQQQIDTSFILSLLNASASACATTLTETDNGAQTRQADFWRLITIDLVLVLLTPKQRLDDVLGMLDLLCTSALPDSIGPIDPGKDLDMFARMILDKVSLNLVDLPSAAVTPREKHAVRLAVLRTLMAFVGTPYGARQIASHSSVIPRLVTALSELVDGLYDLSDPVVHIGGGDYPFSRKDGAENATSDDLLGSDDDGGDARIAPSSLISQIVLLLHSLATDPHTANIANILSKLSYCHGGSQRYIMSLSRLNFAEEDLVYEAGIDADTVDRAHELLELGVTPDEGDSIAESFGV